MKNRIIILLTTLMILLTSSLGVSASTNNIEVAYKAMETYINSSIKVGDKELVGTTIGEYKNLYDGNLNEYGYVFSLHNNGNEGYGIVLNTNGIYDVIETSLDTKSPYTNNESKYLIYTGPFGYFTSNGEKDESGNVILYDLLEQQNLTDNNLTITRNISENNTKATRAATTSTKYLKSYSSKFVKGKQSNNYRCMPASFAMGLLYLHNTGQLTLNSSYRTFPKIEDYLAEQANVDSNKMGYANLLVTTLHNFSTNYSSRRVETKDDEFQPDTFFSTAQTEIGNDCPLVLIFYSGTLYSVNHATTMVGYKVVTSSTGATTQYAIFVDPMTQTERTYKWTSNNVYGYMLFYLY